MKQQRGYLLLAWVIGVGVGLGLGAIPDPIRAADSPHPKTALKEPLRMGPQSSSLYTFTLDDIDGNPQSLEKFRGKVLLLVNTASFCGNTPQYEGLQTMYEQYREKGLEILAFPANNFGRQEPGTNKEIGNFCYTKYSLTFPLFSKISVKGDDKHPLYRYLTERGPFPGEVEWNFQKYLVNREGNVIAKYRPRTEPLSSRILQDVEKALSRN